MLIWFTPGWEEYAKWGAKEEAEIAYLISNKWTKIKEAILDIKKNNDEIIEIELGFGPKGRKYTVIMLYIGKSPENHDFMQMYGLAPITDIQGDIMAKSLLEDVTDKPGENIGVGRIYDDGDHNRIRVIGAKENKRISRQIKDVFKPL